ncbi:phosphorylase [Paraburkholderia sp. J67]|uniref:ATP adenylyltransferase family protein n=1 Tax=Paraburkholderia sp. J67 TaxID=2805435 RepID=UPI002ABD1783|nr:phosphorylase [Paraburkholderia sp. J67]
MAFLTAQTLWPALRAQTRYALQCGALQPIETALSHLHESGVRFAVRQVSSLARKEAARRTDAPTASGSGGSNAARSNPFLPYEPDLCVGELSPTHVALLNKYNVIEDHLLIVTRRFVPQTALLDQADFEALLVALGAQGSGGALGFYNGGEEAGASQPHKHLQAVPLPLDATGPAAPVEALFGAVHVQDGVGCVRGLPFAHAFAPLDLTTGDAAPALLQTYRRLLHAAGIGAIDVDGVAHQGAPYNLLVTRRWMLVVPRTAERVEGISLNALGFAGSLFVRDAHQLDTLARIGPMTALTRVARPRC